MLGIWGSLVFLCFLFSFVVGVCILWNFHRANKLGCLGTIFLSFLRETKNLVNMGEEKEASGTICHAVDCVCSHVFM